MATVEQRRLATTQGIGSVASAFSQYQAGKGQRALSKISGRLSKLKAKSAKRRGAEKEARSRQSFKKLLGKQRAALAAQGIRLDEGSARDIQTETQVMSELDALTIKNNAAREALGLEAGARTTEVGGKLAGARADVGAAETLLTGGLRAYRTLKGI